MAMSESDRKREAIQALLEKRGLDALVLQRVSSFAWATCGAASYVNRATTTGEATLVVMKGSGGLHVVTNNIEAPRLEKEEKLAQQGWKFHAAEWYETGNGVSELTKGLRLGADGPFPGAVDLSGEIARLRARLTPEEGERFRGLGRICAAAMGDCAQAIRPGQTEYEIAGILAHGVEKRGAQVVVNLIASDERVLTYRHPLPTGKKMERYAMLVLCGRRWGLVCSITRLVSFGALPDELRRKAKAVAAVDAAMIAATRPGRTVGQVFERAQDAYVAAGYANEWRLHHQGGPAGYEGREIIATPTSTDEVSAGQAYAWNPSISGTKSEDTILVGEEGNEVLTAIDGWPSMAVFVDGRAYWRPAVLEIR